MNSLLRTRLLWLRGAVLPAFVLFVGCHTVRPAAAQDARVDVQWLGELGFAVHAFAENGGSEERAGQLAMNRACEVAREREQAYLSVSEFNSDLISQQAVTQRGGVRYHGGTDGRPVGATPTSEERGTISYGHAVLVVTMISATSVSGFQNSSEIIETAGCTIYSRPPR